MKENSKEEKEKKKDKKNSEEQEEKDRETHNNDLKFHENFAEVKDALPVFKTSGLEQFVSQAPEFPKNEKDKDKDKKEQVKYSAAGYTANYSDNKDMEWHERDLIAEVDDLRRIGMLVDRQHRTEFRPDFSLERPRVEMPVLPEMRRDTNENIVKYADKKRDVWKDEFGTVHRRDLKKYKHEGE